VSSGARQSVRDVKLGANVRLADFVNLYECEIGDDSRVGAFVEIQAGARIGRNVKISSHTFVCSGVTIEDDVFIGHNVSFINDRHPHATLNGRPQSAADWECVPTLVQRGASIGTSATIMCGVTVGEGATVGAGSVVTRDVPAHSVVAGVPARPLNGAAASAAAEVPFVDLRAQYRSIEGDVRRAVEAVLASGTYVLGPEVKGFESEFAAYCGARFAVAVNSGTSALHLALLAAGVEPGDEVITSPFTFVATAAAIAHAGARPVFVDVEPRSLTLDPERLAAAITPRTRAVVPVHIWGQPADMGAIRAVAGRHGLAVVEDAAQAHGAAIGGRRAGTLGDLACFSFYPAKNLGACGEGGIVVTDDEARASHIATRRDWGQTRRYEHALHGFNYRMDALQGAILRVKLRRLEAWTEARRARAARYDAQLAGLPLVRPTALPERRHVYHVYAIRVAGRDDVRAALGARGIQTGIHYPIPVHLQAAWSHLGYKPGDFPVTEAAAAEVLSLPMFPELEDAAQDRVVQALAAVLR
jgi:dTDP-4-amino-4,6-dideoxygalactose transaminase/acetyltransferase-like isoleucine patch superfamily enzyme